MIDFVHRKLMVWAAWNSKKLSGALGYPKECNYTKLVHSHGVVASFTPDMNDDAQKMEACIVALRATEPNLAEVITLRYMYQTMSDVQIGKRVGCSNKTAKAWVGVAHQRLLGFLNDLEAGITLPTINIKKIA